MVAQFVFALFILFGTVRAWADADDVPGLDVPGQEQKLNQQLWRFAKNTEYDSKTQQVVEEKQALSKTKLSMEVTLPNGWRMAPAGKQLELGRYPMVVVPFAGKLVVLNNGYYVETKPEISICDQEGTKVEKTLLVSSLFPCARVGLDSDLYVSGGYDQTIHRYNHSFDNWKTYNLNGFVAGIAPIDGDHFAAAYLLVDNGQGGYANKGKLALLNTRSGKVEQEIECGHVPYAVESLDDEIFVSYAQDDLVAVFQLENGKLKWVKDIPVGKTPTAFAADREAHRLYVVDQNSDEISVIDTKALALTDTWSLGQKGFKFGAAPTAAALGPNHQLYVSLSRLNAVAVMDRVDGTVMGYIPTGWYPTEVMTDKNRLFILSAKGIRERRPNPDGPQPTKKREEPGYVLTLLRGSLGVLDIPQIKDQLPVWTEQVANSSPIYSSANGFNLPIKYIFYIVKENRTYDQVLGDLGKGNGDPSLTLFGKDITPNHHALAEQFVDLDNFYVDGEISVFGHSYTTSAYVSPFLEWLGMDDYSGRLGAKDAKNPAKNEDFWPFGTAPFTFSPSYLWDAMDAKGVDYRIYGEDVYVYTKPYRLITQKFGANSEMADKCYDQLMYFSKDKRRDTAFTDLVKDDLGRNDSMDHCRKLLDDPAFLAKLSSFYSGDDSLAAAIRTDKAFREQWADLLYRYAFDFLGWDLSYSDLKRAAAWKKDFERQLKAKKVFNFQYLWLPNDHTAGTSDKTLNPYQFVAQNDAAVGVVIDAIAKSPIWKQSLVFVLEDDSQNGPDHVDAMRSPALVAGPYVKRGEVVSDVYDQLGMLRTIEMLLGLDPLNFNDGTAAPMFSVFTQTPNYGPYRLPPPSAQLTDEDQALYQDLVGGKKKRAKKTASSAPGPAPASIR